MCGDGRAYSGDDDLQWARLYVELMLQWETGKVRVEEDC